MANDSQALTERERRFVRAYIGEAAGNATKAATIAGYSANNARHQASRLLAKANIKAALHQRAERADLHADRILEEVRRVAFSDVRELFDDQGKLKPIHELPEDVARAIASVELTKARSHKHGDITTSEHATKIKVWDKLKALELAGRYLSIWQEKEHDRNRVTVNIGFLNPEVGGTTVIVEKPEDVTPQAHVARLGESARGDEG